MANIESGQAVKSEEVMAAAIELERLQEEEKSCTSELPFGYCNSDAVQNSIALHQTAQTEQAKRLRDLLLEFTSTTAKSLEANEGGPDGTSLGSPRTPSALGAESGYFLHGHCGSTHRTAS